MNRKEHSIKKSPSIWRVLGPYKGLITGLLAFAIVSNALNLVIPKIIQKGIDDYSSGTFEMEQIIQWFAFAVIAIFILTYVQSVLQTLASEKVARDLRSKLSAQISGQDYSYIQNASSARLLTNLTSDVDAIKMFVSQAVVSIVSSIVLIVGASILLLNINIKLGLTVLLMIPIIGATFLAIFKKVKVLFRKTQEVIDWLNKVINESIMGAALIRVLNAQFTEYNKFMDASSEAKNLGLSILKLFATLIPIIVLTSSLARLSVLAMGGYFVIGGSMTLGELAAFNSYIAILIFPILIIGFMSNVIARASASWQRIQHVLEAPLFEDKGTVEKEIKGDIELKNVSLYFGEKAALKNISFKVKAGSRTAILGPTAAGKTQLLQLLATLTKPAEGQILYDDIPASHYKQVALLSRIGIVFQDSILFNLSLKKNIAFNRKVEEKDLQKAIHTAELQHFVKSLPNGLDTLVSERGSSLSGGQKQRMMLARALSINPSVLLLDDFTARVDILTEQKISKQIQQNYSGLTLISITQKIEPIKDFDQIILLMEGELVAQGTHEYLIKNCPEYIQIFQSQQSVVEVAES